jgi:hypothetical protein
VKRCMGNPKCAKDCAECDFLPRTVAEENETTCWIDWKKFDKPCAGFSPIVTVK